MVTVYSWKHHQPFHSLRLSLMIRMIDLIFDKKRGKKMKKLAICLIVSLILMSFSVVVMAGTAEKRQGPQNDKFFTQLIPGFLVKPHEAYEWHLYKDMGGATYTGNESWKSYMEFLEGKLQGYGVQDIQRNYFTYNRWYTTDWPGDGKWTLVSDGKPIKVASYGAYSGSTPAGGVTAPLVYWDYASGASRPDVSGKIVVVRIWQPDEICSAVDNEYDFGFDNDVPYSDTHPCVAKAENNSTHTWYMLNNTTAAIRILRETTAAGIIFAWDAGHDTVAGMYTFGVPNLYSNPTLYVGRVEGAKVIQDAQAGKMATVKLSATVEDAEAYQLVCYLPGKNYGTVNDEQIWLNTHTDGPSIAQDNGALGLLGIVKYFSNIPQEERPRTLFIKLNPTHYVPSGHRGNFTDWLTLHPEAKNPIVALIGTEMLGQIAFREIGETFEPNGFPEYAYLWARDNQLLIDMAFKAARDNDWTRCLVRAPERPGPRGLAQSTWFGEGSVGTMNTVGKTIPGFSTMQTTGAYWATTARVDNAFDAEHFCKQVATFTQLTGELMVADLIPINPVWGILRTRIATDKLIVNSPTPPYTPDSAFSDPAKRADLVAEIDEIFTNVKAGDYAAALTKLNTLKADVTSWIKLGSSQDAIIKLIDEAIALLS